MNSKKKQLARLGKYSNYVTGFILVFVILFSFYAIGLINRFTVINQSWHQYTSKMVMVSDELAKLQSALGYGGFIHNFKNYLIRKDPANWQLLKQDIRQINQALDNLNSYFEYEEELVAVKSIRMTVAAYEAKLLLLKNTSNLAVKDLDELVKQSDEEALQALSILKNRTHELNIKQQQDTSLAFKQAMNWMYFGSFLFALVLLFSFLLLKVLSYLKSATQDLITTVEDGELLMQHAPDPMIRVAENGTIANCNLQLESLFGYKKNELIGQNLSILLPDVVTKKHHQHLSEYFTQPENRLMAQNRPNLYGKHKDKNLIPIEISLSSSTISDVKFATATIRDISARLETEKELKESITKAKQSYEQLKQMQVTLGETRMTNIMLEKLPLGTVLYTSEGKLIIANDRLLADTNYSRSELSSIKFEDFIEFENTEDQIIFAKITSAKASKINRSLTMLAKIKPQYDQMFPVELHISTYAYNEQFFWLITYTNLTDVMLVQNRLMQSHEQLARAVSATEDGIWEWNIVEDKVNFSPKFMQLIGKSNEAYPEYKHWFEHIHPDFRAKVDKAIATHFATHSLYEVEYLGLNENGEYNWFMSIGNSLFNEQNKPVLMSGSIRNIHKSKMLEIEAAEKSEFLNTIYEGSSHAIWVLNVEANNEFRFLVFNPTACRTIGVTESAIKNKTISEITPAIFTTEAAEKYRNHYSICASKATHLSYVESIEINHEINWFRTDLYPIIDSSNKVTKIIGTAVNITEQKNVEIELENNKTFLEKIINSTICGLYLYDLKENKNTTFNARYTEILGYKIEELNQATDLEQFYHPADRDKMRQHMAKVTSATSNQVFSVKMRIKHKDGHWVWCYSFDSIVKFDKNGAPELMLGTFVDITEQTLLLEKLQDSNQYLENFAFIASHDLQEPLRKITAFSNSLSQRLEQQRANDEHIEFEFSRLVSASERMRNMIKDLLKLSRINSSELEISPVSLDIILKESIDLLSHLIEEQQAHIKTVNTDYILNVDKGLFVQLFQNLIANSIKFKNKNNNPFINISLVNGLEDIEIIFTDNGIGVANKFTEQIFEPFRRLHSKERYPGSGIGLALCRQILSIHRGTITCMNDVTEGCEFRIILPKINIKGL